MPFSCVLQFAPDSASFVLSFALDVPSRSLPFPLSPIYAVSSPCRRNRPLLPGNLQLALHKVCTCSFLYHFKRTDGAHWDVCTPRVGGLNFTPFVFLVFGIRSGMYAPVTTSFFEQLFVVLFLVNCTLDCVPRYSIPSSFSLFNLSLILLVD